MSRETAVYGQAIMLWSGEGDSSVGGDFSSQPEMVGLELFVSSTTGEEGLDLVGPEPISQITSPIAQSTAIRTITKFQFGRIELRDIEVQDVPSQ